MGLIESSASGCEVLQDLHLKVVLESFLFLPPQVSSKAKLKKGI